MLILLCVFLFFFSVLVLIRLFYFKKQLKHLSEETEKNKSADYNQPIRIDDYDRDLLNLAVKINDNNEIKRRLYSDYLQQKNKINIIISGLAHDFRTPLTASLGYLQMIKKNNELSEKNKEYLNIIMQKNEYLKELSDSFFELSKLENDCEIIENEVVNLSNVLSDMIIAQYDWINEKLISLEIKIKDGIIINTNHHYLARIFQNLFSNAEKYAYSRFVVRLSVINDKIDIVFYHDFNNDELICIDKIFDPFYKTNSRNNDGTGLGLYIVHSLCEKLGFTVKAYIDKNRIFHIRITI